MVAVNVIVTAAAVRVEEQVVGVAVAAVAAAAAKEEGVAAVVAARDRRLCRCRGIVRSGLNSLMTVARCSRGSCCRFGNDRRVQSIDRAKLLARSTHRAD